MIDFRVWIVPAFLVAAAATAPGLAAQTADSTAGPRGTVVSGVVRDSIAQLPLAGATVQLVGIDRNSRVARTTISDSLGWYTLAGVPAGRYSLGFFHPALESLGIEPPVRELFLLGDGEVRGDLATPSPERFREAVCGVAKSSDPGAIVVGVVRDVRDYSVVAGAQVSGEWLEMTFTKKGVLRQRPRLVSTTAENGWFAMCDVPSPGTMLLRASRGADTLDVVEVQIPAHGVVSNELFFGSAAVAVTNRSADSAIARPSQVRTGNGHLSGAVVSADDGRPLGGARVHIIGGPQTRANARGEWKIDDAPSGTRMLEVQSIGFYPERRPVNVVAEAPPVRVRLSTVRSVLDAIRVSANRTPFMRSGFSERRRSSAGTFLTEIDIARRGALTTSEIFKTVPSIRIENGGVGPRKIWMRGPYGYCEPSIFLDGNRVGGLTADDIDDFFRTNEVAAIEIYSEASVPAQFREYTTMGVCGSIVIWRK
ncbi:MAG: carboxypeptidase-like regulatory domain-containing protein [Gemmatimonadota bacterium]|nr:carboxypeptidase-like regulatory domain-containing protein [Gemmatimonadota bacterium]